MSEDHRRNKLLAWYRQWSGDADADVSVVSGDASFRRYFRAELEGKSVILVDSPPAQEKNHEFVAIGTALRSAGVRVPEVLRADLDHGFLAQEDFGDELLLPALNLQNAGSYYGRALSEMRVLFRLDPAPDVPPYTAERLADEMELFPAWFCQSMLKTEIPDVLWQPLVELLCGRATSQQQGTVHRDFHARNIMLLDDGSLGLIDFQDAVIGPVTYDVVSLLKDCYIRWPDERVEHWALGYRHLMLESGVAMPSEDAFLTDFHWMGLQRHIKVLGIFVRLYERDGKATYLGDLSRVMGYVLDTLLNDPHPLLQEFYRWFTKELSPKVEQQSWFNADELRPRGDR
ncbi:MAG: phosphotransferase [Pseudomonadota bacterium]